MKPELEQIEWLQVGSRVVPETKKTSDSRIYVDRKWTQCINSPLQIKWFWACPPNVEEVKMWQEPFYDNEGKEGRMKAFKKIQKECDYFEEHGHWRDNKLT